MREEAKRDEVLNTINNVIKEIEALEVSFSNLGKLPDYLVHQEDILNQLKSLYGTIDKTYNVKGTLHLPLSGEAYILDTNGNKHSVRKKHVEIDIEGNEQYLTVHIDPKKNAQQFDTWAHLSEYNGKTARF